MTNDKTEIDEALVGLFKRVIEGFIIHKKDLEIEHSEKGDSTHIRFWVNESDMPKVLGRHRKNYNAVEYVFRYAYHLYGYNFRMTLEDPKVGHPEPSTPFIPNRDWDSTDFEDRFDKLLSWLFDDYEFDVQPQKDAMSEAIARIDGEETHVMEALFQSLNLLLAISGKRDGRLVRFSWRTFDGQDAGVGR